MHAHTSTCINKNTANSHPRPLYPHAFFIPPLFLTHSNTDARTCTFLIASLSHAHTRTPLHFPSPLTYPHAHDLHTLIPPRACITSHGRLADRWSYIARLRELQQIPLGAAMTYSDNTVMDLEMRVGYEDMIDVVDVIDMIAVPVAV